MICVHRTDLNKIDTGNLWIRNVMVFEIKIIFCEVYDEVKWKMDIL